jgi:hypothetical protein
MLNILGITFTLPCGPQPEAWAGGGLPARSLTRPRPGPGPARGWPGVESRSQSDHDVKSRSSLHELGSDARPACPTQKDTLTDYTHAAPAPAAGHHELMM